MSLQPDTDERLDATSKKLSANGVRLLVLAVTLDVIGAILLIAGISTVAGLFCIGLSLAPTIGALMLMGSGAVGQRASEQKDFA